MKAIVRAVLLAVLAGFLQQCAPVQGCSQIAQKSEGACRVGLPPGWYEDDGWRDE